MPPAHGRRRPDGPSPAPPPLVGFVVHGAGGVHPASAHIRVTGRMSALAASGAARVAQVDPVRWADGSDTAHLDVLLVQRDAFPLASLDAAIDRAHREGTRIVAEVDDDFFSREARDRLARAEYDPDRLAAVERLVAGRRRRRGHSTEPLARGARRGGHPRRGGPERGAARAVGDRPGPARTRPARAGSSTWGPRRTATTSACSGRRSTAWSTTTGAPVRLEVVGVTRLRRRPGTTGSPLPEGATHYPEFVAFLRENAHRWSAGVAPLTADPFNDAKSDLKFLEYSMLGLPVRRLGPALLRRASTRTAVCSPPTTGRVAAGAADRLP